MSRTFRAAPTRRAHRIGLLLSSVAALAVSTGLVLQASYAAYSSTTSDGTNTWATGSVVLTDDDAGSAMFTATGLKPGSTGTRCIVVTSNGSLPSAVKLYGNGLSTTNGLSGQIDLTITQGTGGSFGSCTGFTPQASGASVYSGTLAGFTATGYAGGLGTWTPTGSPGETRTFQFAYTVRSSAPDSTQNGTAAVSFVWEAQNT